MTDDLARDFGHASDDQLAGVIDDLAGSDSPEQHEFRATLLEELASRGMMRPPAQLAEAADARARAAVQRAIGRARAGLETAAGLVTLAEQAVTATEAPERKANDHAVTAGQLLARASDDLKQAADAGAEPARLIELRGRVGDAEAVDQHERGRLATAQQVTATARSRLAEARDCQRKARTALAAAEAALDQPLRASIDRAALMESLLFTWPARSRGARTGEQPPLSDDECEIIPVLAAIWADFLGAIPAGAAAHVNGQRDAEIREWARRTMIGLPGGQQASVAGLMTGHGVGVGGPNALAPLGQGR